jgi:hydroxymethylbilane synthase
LTTTGSPLVIASRGSRLALRQCELVKDLLHSAHPDLDVRVQVVQTRGDKDPRPFNTIGAKGLFTSEVEAVVARGEADLAVHSAKDLTSELADGCAILCAPARASRADVVVGGEGDSGEERLGALAPGARVGTSSMRRRALLLEARPDLEPVEFRGNVDTRMAKVAAGEVDAALLAAAGLERLGAAGGAALDPSWWVPAPGQGILALEGRTDRPDLLALLEPIEDAATRAELECERAFATTLEGGCSVPLGCSASADGDRLLVMGFLGMPDGSHGMRDRISGGRHEAAALGRELAEAIRSCGGDDILAELAHEPFPPIPEP